MIWLNTDRNFLKCKKSLTWVIPPNVVKSPNHLVACFTDTSFLLTLPIFNLKIFRPNSFKCRSKLVILFRRDLVMCEYLSYCHWNIFPDNFTKFLHVRGLRGNLHSIIQNGSTFQKRQKMKEKNWTVRFFSQSWISEFILSII